MLRLSPLQATYPGKFGKNADGYLFPMNIYIYIYRERERERERDLYISYTNYATEFYYN